MDQLELDTQQGFIIRMNSIFNQITSVELIPYHIYGYSQPKPVEGSEAEQILNDIIIASKLLIGIN